MVELEELAKKYSKSYEFMELTYNVALKEGFTHQEIIEGINEFFEGIS